MQFELNSIPQTNLGIELLSIIVFNVVFNAVLEWLFALILGNSRFESLRSTVYGLV